MCGMKKMSYDDSAFYVAEANRKNHLKAPLKPFVGILSGRNAPVIKSNDTKAFRRIYSRETLFPRSVLATSSRVCWRSVTLRASCITEGKSHNVPSASKEMVVITDFSLTFVTFRFAEKGRER